MDVLTPRSLDEALRLKAEHPDAVPVQGGTDVLVSLNFDRLRPETILNLNEVEELRGYRRENGTWWLGAGLTYTEAMREPVAEALPALAEASRTVGSPQIRNRGTIGGNLGTASPAGDALPPLFVEGAEVEVASAGGSRRLRLDEFLLGPKKNALAADELILGVYVQPSGQPPDLHEGRAAQRHGDRGLLARARRRSRTGGDPRLVRIGLPCDAARDRAARSGRGLPGGGRCRGEPDRRRPRNRCVPAARAPRADEARTRQVPRMTRPCGSEPRSAVGLPSR